MEPAVSARRQAQAAAAESRREQQQAAQQQRDLSAQLQGERDRREGLRRQGREALGRGCFFSEPVRMSDVVAVPPWTCVHVCMSPELDCPW